MQYSGLVKALLTRHECLAHVVGHKPWIQSCILQICQTLYENMKTTLLIVRSISMRIKHGAVIAPEVQKHASASQNWQATSFC